MSEWVEEGVRERASEWVKEWVSEWKSEWVSERVKEWVSERKREWESERVSEKVKEWVTEWGSENVSVSTSARLVKKWVSEWMNGWCHQQTSCRVSPTTKKHRAAFDQQTTKRAAFNVLHLTNKLKSCRVPRTQTKSLTPYNKKGARLSTQNPTPYSKTTWRHTLKQTPDAMLFWFYPRIMAHQYARTYSPKYRQTWNVEIVKTQSWTQKQRGASA